jgi:CDGSH-type Zn-finger protein
MSDFKIKITHNGPYIVSGGVPLFEKIITARRHGYVMSDGRILPQSKVYPLCRCGKTKTPPFCDGTHMCEHFDGTETASRENFVDRLEGVLEGPTLNLLDDGRCAYARFCHRDSGSVWDLIRKSDDPRCRMEAILAAYECPSGRLVANDKSGKPYEPEYEPSIEILQDAEQGLSGPIFVKGMIPIEGADGHSYEVRNRVTLCRCGKSKIKPFCDAAHITWDYKE